MVSRAEACGCGDHLYSFNEGPELRYSCTGISRLEQLRSQLSKVIGDRHIAEEACHVDRYGSILYFRRLLPAFERAMIRSKENSDRKCASQS
jgi:hypothetical protein